MSDDVIENELENKLDSFLAKLDITPDDYEKALKISERGKIVILKRTLKERFVNNYHPEWMMAWQGNHDIQFCYDNYAVVTYITDYLSKGDAGVTEALKKALKETKGCNDLERLNYLKKTYLTHRQCSVAEAAYRIGGGMNLKGSNVKNIFVSTGYPENRSHFYRKVKDENGQDLDSDSDDDDNEQSQDNQGLIEIENRKGKFQKVETIHNKYSNRPDALGNVCLAQFASSYETCAKPKESILETFENGASSIEGFIEHFATKEKLPKHIQLKTGGYMRLRNSPLILRIHSSKKKKEEEEGIYSELLLFFPWTDENEIRENCQDNFNNNFETIKMNKKAIYPNSTMVDVMRNLIQNPEEARPIHLVDMDAAGEQENLDDEEELEPLDTTELPEEEPDTSGKRNVKSTLSLFKPIVVDEMEVMLNLARSLSFGQRIVFDKIIKFSKEVLRANRGAHIVPTPPQLIVTGKKKLSNLN